MPKKVFIAARFSFVRVFCCSCLSWAQHINARYKDSCITLKITHRMRTFFLCTALHVASMSDFRELAVMRNTLQSRELLFCIARRSRSSALRHDISVSSIFFSNFGLNNNLNMQQRRPRGATWRAALLVCHRAQRLRRC